MAAPCDRMKERTQARGDQTESESLYLSPAVQAIRTQCPDNSRKMEITVSDYYEQ